MLSNSFKWKHFVGEIILLNVRWYLKYPLSYRNLKEMMIERGIQVDHSTIMRWVHQYSPEIEKKIRRHLRPTNDSWRVDETYIKVKGKWKYFYRAVDSNGDTIDFMLSTKRNKKAANRFFKKALNSNHNQIPKTAEIFLDSLVTKYTLYGKRKNWVCKGVHGQAGLDKSEVRTS